MTKSPEIIQFQLPQALACPLPTETRGINRDDVRLLVSQNDGEQISHHRFYQLKEVLKAGDVLVVNTSATLPAAIPIHLPDKQDGRLHLSTQLDSNRWLVEIRAIQHNQSKRWKAGKAGQSFLFQGGGQVQLIKRYYQDLHLLDLWEARLQLPLPLNQYLHRYGKPIQYQNLNRSYPLAYYQTVFSETPGSSEMPSAARGFTSSLVDHLVEKGIEIVPVLLHTGISSLEIGERPYPEYTAVSHSSAKKINRAIAENRRIIAVGTTAIRALESAVDETGNLQAFQGFTELFIRQNYQMKVVDGLLTGFHEPAASHLYMLQALASKPHLRKAYQAAIDEGYYWHEFGDLHLILP